MGCFQRWSHHARESCYCTLEDYESLTLRDCLKSLFSLVQRRRVRPGRGVRLIAGGKTTGRKKRGYPAPRRGAGASGERKRLIKCMSEAVKSELLGLSSEEATARLARYGPNILTTHRRRALL